MTRRIVRYLTQNIQSGAWQVGSRIPSENELCRELGVSRVSVRSALQQLITLGLLESVHGKGTFLISDDLSAFEAPEALDNRLESIEEMRQVLDFRIMVEPPICEQVAMRADPALIARLQALLDTMRRSVGNNRAFVDADRQFHLEICAAYGNPVVQEILENTFQKRAEPHYMVSLANGFYGGIYYHGLILDAFRKRDWKRARSLMDEHLRHGLDELDTEPEGKADGSKF